MVDIENFEPKNSYDRKLKEMLQHFWLPSALFVAVELDIAELLEIGSKSISELALLINSNEESLYKLLKALASLGIFLESYPCIFENTPMSCQLSTSAEGSIKPWIKLLGQEWYQSAWGDLLYSIRTGKQAFSHINGKKLFDFLEESDNLSKVFNEDMEFDTRSLENLFIKYDFTKFDKVIDVGGGYGTLMISLLKQNPHLSGIILETPRVSVQAKKRIHSAGLGDRCEVITGDMFKYIPEGGDLYILKNILHDWEDEDARQVLKNCRCAILNQGTILIIEGVLDSQDIYSSIHYVNLAMLVLTGGKERTLKEYENLLNSTSFRLREVFNTPYPLDIIEAVSA